MNMRFFVSHTNDDDLIENPVYQSNQVRSIRATMQLLRQSTTLPFLYVIPHRVLMTVLLLLTVIHKKKKQFNLKSR